MSIFTKHTDKTAPKGAAEVLAKVMERYGFIPNLAAYVAEAPQALDAVMALSSSFDKTAFAPKEQQLILLIVSVMNGCDYCRTAHTGMGRMAGLDDATVKAALRLERLPDDKLNALMDFTSSMVKEKGFVSDDKVLAFLNAGYTKGQVFELVMGIALKTLSNYCNHLAKAKPNPEFVAMAEGRGM
ncbi:MAG: carboxymuconolactone decarboxylase family protein [Deltaproteobacteria bacterium]|nr:carboxymuconolactone decarboxylase family protein [Deltaproteobacteria bacterium]